MAESAPFLWQFLVWFLRTYWLLGVGSCILGLLPPLPFVAPLQEALLGFVRRGKLLQHTSSLQAWTVPQSWFTHFYITGVASTSILLAMAILRVCSSPEHAVGDQTLLLLLLMEAHVMRRVYESLYVSKFSPAARMHVMAYLVGIFYYVAVPLSLLSLDMAAQKAGPPPDIQTGYRNAALMLWSWRWWQWLGTGIYACGFLHQHRCHRILASLRTPGRKNSGSKHSSGYSIPSGDWFDLVSCAHYFAEIVIYLGLLIISGGEDVTIWLLFTWVVANLVIPALETHEWYCHRFKDYPRTRRAIIPFLL